MPTQGQLNRAAAEARKAVHAALGAEYDRRRLTIARFARHADGYLHARIVVDDRRTYYFYLRFGSWLAPANLTERHPLLREPEAVLGAVLGRELKFVLSEYAARFERAETPREEESR